MFLLRGRMALLLKLLWERHFIVLPNIEEIAMMKPHREFLESMTF